MEFHWRPLSPRCRPYCFRQNLIFSLKTFKSIVKMNVFIVRSLPTDTQRRSGARRARSDRELRVECATWESLKNLLGGKSSPRRVRHQCHCGAMATLLFLSQLVNGGCTSAIRAVTHSVHHTAQWRPVLWCDMSSSTSTHVHAPHSVAGDTDGT